MGSALGRSFAAAGHAVTFTLSRDPTRRRHFLPNFLKVLARRPSRVVEAAIHLGLWQHFEAYVPLLAGRLDDAASRERVRERERSWAASAPLARPLVALAPAL